MKISEMVPILKNGWMGLIMADFHLRDAIFENPLISGVYPNSFSWLSLKPRIYHKILNKTKHLLFQDVYVTDQGCQLIMKVNLDDNSCIAFG